MESIRDLTWVKHLRSGTVVERLNVASHRVVSLRLPSGENSAPEQYLFRMLFFPPGTHKPCLALNLERSILGTACYTEQAGVSHSRHGTVEETTSYEDFRRWALSRAEELLGLASPEVRAVG